MGFLEVSVCCDDVLAKCKRWLSAMARDGVVGVLDAEVAAMTAPPLGSVRIPER